MLNNYQVLVVRIPQQHQINAKIKWARKSFKKLEKKINIVNHANIKKLDKDLM